MRSFGLIIFMVLALFGLGFLLLPADNLALAQGDNLLANPSFEGQYSSYVPETPQELADCPRNICTTAQLPQGWKPWWVKERPTDVNPEYKPAEANVGGSRIHSGARAAQYFSFWSTHKAGLRQTVNVPDNALVEFSVFGQAWISEEDNASVSDRSGTPNMQIGIDPTGGTNPYSPNVVWSGYQQPYDAYVRFAVQAQAQGEQVTVFTFSAPSVNPNSPEYGFKHNDIYWDDASLVVVGAGAPPPAAGGGDASLPPVPAAAYVPGPTATPNAEGIIYVEVQSGDSVWALAARAGISLDEFLELNQMGKDDLLRPGDMLIIGHGEPPGPEPAAEEAQANSEEAPAAEGDAVASEPQAEATPEPTAEAVAEVAAKSTDVSVCLTAFDDVDGNGVQDANDALKPDVAFTISDGQSVVSNYVTNGESEPFCVSLPGPGSYRVARSILPNEILTTAGDRAISLSEGSSLDLEFGSTMGDETLAMASNTSAEQAAAVTQDQAAAADDGNTLLTVAVIAAVVVAVLLLVAVIAIVVTNRRANAA